MLEPILKGLVEWIYQMMVDIMSYASGELLGVMSMDLSYFESTAPIISDIVDVFVALGWALLIGNLVFQALKSIMSGAGFEAEDPKILFLRTFVFAFLLLASRQICDIGLSITGTVIDLLALPDAINVTTPDESMFSLGSGAKWLLVIIVGVVLMVQMVKLLFEIGERYVITSVLTFFAPLAFAMGGSKNTNDIFKGWVRMYCSMLVMMIMNIVFLKLIMSAMSQMAAGGVLVWLVFVVALTRVARKIDSHIGKIGLNPAQTGDGLGLRLPGMMSYVAVRTMSSLVGRSMVNAKGGSGGKTGRNGNNGRGGFSGRSRNPNPYGPRPSSSGGGNAVNNRGGMSTANSGTNVHNGTANTKLTGANTNIGKSDAGTANREILTNSDVKGGNLPKTVQSGKNGSATINQGTQYNGQQRSHTAISQPQGNPQRPPIPRGTAGISPGQNTQAVSAVYGGIHAQPNRDSPHINGERHTPGTTMKGAVPVVAPSVMPGGTPTVDTEGARNRLDMQGNAHNGAYITVPDVHDSQIGGSVGCVTVSNVQAGGSTRIRSEKTGGEHYTDRSTERFRERSQSGFSQRQSRTETAEKRINHEYRNGKYNPAAANRKVKKVYYKKENQRGYRQSIAPQVKRGESDRK